MSTERPRARSLDPCRSTRPSARARTRPRHESSHPRDAGPLASRTDSSHPPRCALWRAVPIRLAGNARRSVHGPAETIREGWVSGGGVGETIREGCGVGWWGSVRRFVRGGCRVVGVGETIREGAGCARRHAWRGPLDAAVRSRIGSTALRCRLGGRRLRRRPRRRRRRRGMRPTSPRGGRRTRTDGVHRWGCSRRRYRRPTRPRGA